MKLRYLFAALLGICVLITPAAAAGGSGTAASPYIIETAAELQSMQNDLSAYYRLANDIDLSGATWSPIGSESAGFYGELDGNGKTIKNLELSATTSSSGLFGMITSGATIKDLTLEDCHVESTSTRCGCLIGSIIMSSSAHETATLQNIDMVRCSATSSDNIVGVLCGLIYTEAVVDITDCTLMNCEAESTEGRYVGVLCGGCNDGSGEITGCTVTYSHGMAAASYVGALCGGCTREGSLIMTDCIVDTCIVESTTAGYVGALCGFSSYGSSVSAENCVAENNIVKAATGHIGGIFGGIYLPASSIGVSSIGATGCTVKECTLVTTGNYVGGIAGRVASGTTGVFDSCTVTGCTILATSYAAAICPAYS